MAAASILAVTTTVSSAEEAQAIARELVEQRLAACVQADSPVMSTYRWDGRVQHETEIRLVIKTCAEREPQLRAWLVQRHPYDLPQYTVATLEATQEYAAWVRQETS